MKRKFNPEIWPERRKFNPSNWLPRSEHKRNSYNSNKQQISKFNEVNIVVQRVEEKQIDLTCKYEDWLKIGFAFASEFGESGREYFHRVSRFYPDYNSSSTDRQFNKCLQGKKSGATIKSFFQAAKDAGINIRV